MKKVFINYSWEYDVDKAEELYSVLSGHPGFRLWMDKKDIQGGLKWKPAIRKAIRESDFFISLLSKKSVKGRGVRNREIYEALDVLKEFPPSDVYLIPARIDDCIPPFEEMADLNWVNLFPDKSKGISELLKALGIKKPVKQMLEERKDVKISNLLMSSEKKVKAEKSSKALSLRYHYRVGIVDLDLKLSNIQKIANQLNKIQSYFLFTTPEMPALKRCTETIAGSKNFAVYKVPKSFINKHRHLDVDLVACLTKYPLAFEEKNKILYNYFAGPSDQDERFLFLSADNLYKYCKKAKCTFEEGLVYILVGQIVAYFTDIGYHEITKKCVMDFCENRDDIISGLESRRFCSQCLKKLPEGELKDALMKLMEWKYSERSSN